MPRDDDHGFSSAAAMTSGKRATIGHEVGFLHAVDINARLPRCIEHMSQIVSQPLMAIHTGRASAST
ncbi:hypothetical protein BOSE46_80589 [Bosea sp. 46]|nr:hypothetical protein BOSE21B_90501 [Bosea sp. 21B]CAD5296868.1 hypothetical protein BOSE46_80589 [Bosea sp. 46]CAD5297251.1 hypothetical protein BOSE7B_60164 [Bosea sp. 7B]VXB26852.1 hypothetical protein BOSE127_110163 [Bosea sp. 127]